jgi:serine/threonine protein kinase
MMGKEPFPGWIIKEEIGQGKFGKVFRAEKDGYSSAIKQMLIPNDQEYQYSYMEYNGDEEKILKYYKPEADRLKKEVEVMQQLSGIEGIVIYNDHLIRQCENRAGWEILIRMEYLIPIHKYIGKNGLKIKQLLIMGQHLSNALEACYKENILHRDIKESNILVNSRGTFKLVDFGVSKSFDKVSVASTIAGTYGYMAPEIVRGEKYDHRADIYSLGIFLYKLLNGNLFPFMKHGDTIREAEKSRFLLFRGEPIPEPINGNEEISRVILKAVSYDKEDRYVSFSEMGEEFKKLLAASDNDVLEESIIFAEDNNEKREELNDISENNSDNDETLLASKKNKNNIKKEDKKIENNNLNEKENLENKLSLDLNSDDDRILYANKQNSKNKEEFKKDENKDINTEKEVLKDSNNLDTDDDRTLFAASKLNESINHNELKITKNDNKKRELKEKLTSSDYEETYTFKTNRFEEKAPEMKTESKNSKSENNNLKYKNKEEITNANKKAKSKFIFTKFKLGILASIVVLVIFVTGYFAFAMINNDNDGNYKTAQEYYDNGNYDKAIEYYKLSAESGNEKAEYNIGVMFYNGDGVEISDEKAFNWFKSSAENGYDEAQYWLGVMFYNGQGTEVNDEKAIYWLQKSADQGHKKAKKTLESLGY